MSEWIESLKDNFQVGDIVAVLSMIGAVIAANIAWVSKLKAANSEAQAARFAKNADEANQSAKRYYDEMHEHLEKQNVRDKMNILKKGIILKVEHGLKFDLSIIASKVELPEDMTEELLKEMELDGLVKHIRDAHGNEKWKIMG